MHVDQKRPQLTTSGHAGKVVEAVGIEPTTKDATGNATTTTYVRSDQREKLSRQLADRPRARRCYAARTPLTAEPFERLLLQVVGWSSMLLLQVAGGWA